MGPDGTLVTRSLASYVLSLLDTVQHILTVLHTREMPRDKHTNDAIPIQQYTALHSSQRTRQILIGLYEYCTVLQSHLSVLRTSDAISPDGPRATSSLLPRYVLSSHT